ncbi:TPA: hypothetical protein RQK47_001361 [Vibrio vulnificus]|jgi:hypothetical protein|uniref:hypothetical protein n=1 Tax=Vibrio parahaemolyticus TaxID=670 RepID=UPI001B8426EF|nr:hypothetical protein [Vibrio parahaemolyticus]EKO3427036.1 hypothetical protein [Vibrio fluvialis]HDY7916930.1 hypothetical protein [Vibrio vulnificus]EGQ8234619.1 hypothetical protein [Vibrio parahaemolyticus]EJA3098452.1 hypothetical protein [Vibrio parahaemolyticus]MDG2841823.1 hypothetical protein [Vibrio parahaemolyticus]
MNKLSEEKVNSLKNIELILKDIINEPEKYHESTYLIKSLESQGGLAKFEGHIVINEERLEVSPSSINTQKRQAKVLFSEGYNYINSLRNCALEAIITSLSVKKKENRRTKQGLYNTLKSKDKLIECYKEEHLVWIQIIDRAKNEILSISKIDDQKLREHRAKNAVKKLNATLSMIDVFSEDSCQESNISEI